MYVQCHWDAVHGRRLQYAVLAQLVGALILVSLRDTCSGTRVQIKVPLESLNQGHDYLIVLPYIDSFLSTGQGSMKRRLSTKIYRRRYSEITAACNAGDEYVINNCQGCYAQHCTVSKHCRAKCNADAADMHLRPCSLVSHIGIDISYLSPASP